MDIMGKAPLIKTSPPPRKKKKQPRPGQPKAKGKLSAMFSKLSLSNKKNKKTVRTAKPKQPSPSPAKKVPVKTAPWNRPQPPIPNPPLGNTAIDHRHARAGLVANLDLPYERAVE